MSDAQQESPAKLAQKKEHCPIAGIANECAAEQAPPAPVCWCSHLKFPKELIRLVPEPAKHRMCLARETVEAWQHLVQVRALAAEVAEDDLPAARLLIAVEAVARRRSRKMVSLHHAWREVLSRLAAAGLPHHQFIRIAPAVESLGDLRRFADMLTVDTKQQAAADTAAVFLDAVDASDYSVSDWVGALALYAEHMRGQNRRASLLRATGYIECCATAANSAALTLSRTVEGMIDAYGVSEDGAE